VNEEGKVNKCPFSQWDREVCGPRKKRRVANDFCGDTDAATTSSLRCTEVAVHHYRLNGDGNVIDAAIDLRGGVS